MFNRDLPKQSSTEEVAQHSRSAQPSATDEPAKHHALAEADALRGDEAAAVAFILRCGYADARLRAAEHVHDRQLMEQVLKAMRKLDRRVSRLMQTRIDAIVKQEMIARHARDCIADARLLLGERPLAPNRVADLDRNWRSIGEAGEAQQAEFAALRREMDDRLLAQTVLQRSAIDLLDSLRKLKVRDVAAELSDVTERLDRIEYQMSEHRLSPEAASLPRSLLSEYDQLLADLKQQDAATQRPASQPESAAVRAEEAEVPSTPEVSAAPQVETVLHAELQVKIEEVLAAMEQSLQAGALHQASKHESAIQAMVAKKVSLVSAQMARWNHLRADLKRLQGWARWSGKVSREGLIKDVESLLARQLPIGELAKAVVASRERWKSLDAASGPAGKALWERFDAACGAAYAPVAEHTRKLAHERQQNADKAKGLIGELRQLASSSTGEHDWKRWAHIRRTVLQGWERLGPTDRKSRKRLSSEFESAMHAVTEPLRTQWQIEIENRERMIHEAESISPSDRRAPELIRSVQARWQESAKTMSLERVDEQRLWQRFRSACNAVFAQKKAANAQADEQRKHNAAERRAICERLEAVAANELSEIRRAMVDAEAAWSRAGPAPRAVEKEIDARYRKAIAALRTKQESARKTEKQSLQRALLEKLKLCEALESALADGRADDLISAIQWESLPLLLPAFEKPMRARFDAALKARDSGDAVYATLLEGNRARMQRELLRLELQAGIEPPVELAQQKRQLQIEALRSSLSGQRRGEPPARLEDLCGLAALTDRQSTERLRRLLNKA